MHLLWGCWIQSLLLVKSWAITGEPWVHLWVTTPTVTKYEHSPTKKDAHGHLVTWSIVSQLSHTNSSKLLLLLLLLTLLMISVTFMLKTSTRGRPIYCHTLPLRMLRLLCHRHRCHGHGQETRSGPQWSATASSWRALISGGNMAAATWVNCKVDLSYTYNCQL